VHVQSSWPARQVNVLIRVCCLEALQQRMADIKHVIVVLSGKGGVGKSTVASQLALAFMRAGKRVGILDVDLCGPSIPRMTGLESHEVHQSPQGYVVSLDSLVLDW
jgi:Mrp family chromosome partitioning ATPase